MSSALVGLAFSLAVAGCGAESPSASPSSAPIAVAKGIVVVATHALHARQTLTAADVKTVSLPVTALDRLEPYDQPAQVVGKVVLVDVATGGVLSATFTVAPNQVPGPQD